MADGLGVHTDEMRAHAQHLQAVTDQIGVAQDAAGQASLNGVNAYGILCSPILTPLIGAIEVAGMTAIGTSNAAVEATATGITGMANTYDEHEQQLSDMLQKIIDALETS